MKHQIVTDPSQSARLLACGVDLDSADMVWTTWDNDEEELTQLSVLDESAYEMGCLNPIEAWSLSALLELLPRQINDSDFEYRLVLSPSRYSKGWIIEYIDEDANETLHGICGPLLIEGCVLMIEWLVHNAYTLNMKNCS